MYVFLDSTCFISSVVYLYQVIETVSWFIYLQSSLALVSTQLSTKRLIAFS